MISGRKGNSVTLPVVASIALLTGCGGSRGVVDETFRYGSAPRNEYVGVSSDGGSGSPRSERAKGAAGTAAGAATDGIVVSESQESAKLPPGLPREPSEGRVDGRPQPAMSADTHVAFLHHSTGEVIWKAGIHPWFVSYNARTGKRYAVEAMPYPDGKRYPWDNYPFDYWNIWVAHAGPNAYSGQATLELLTKQYQVIVWKHCFPVSAIEADSGSSDIASSRKSIANFQAQYVALRTKMREFRSTRFIVWTGAALKADASNLEQGRRARQFFDWVVGTWDEPGDNIYVWDFYRLETNDGLFLLPAFATNDSHPNEAFAARVAPLLAQRIVDVIEGRGDIAPVVGGVPKWP